MRFPEAGVRSRRQAMRTLSRNLPESRLEASVHSRFHMLTLIVHVCTTCYTHCVHVLKHGMSLVCTIVVNAHVVLPTEETPFEFSACWNRYYTHGATGRETPFESSAFCNRYYTHCAACRQCCLSSVCFASVTIHMVRPLEKRPLSLVCIADEGVRCGLTGMDQISVLGRRRIFGGGRERVVW